MTAFSDAPVKIRARDARSRATARRSTSPDPIRRSTGSVNANYAITLSACLYAFRCLVERRRALQRRRRRGR